MCIETLNAQRTEELYRVYETDCLYLIANSLGVNLTKRFYDVLHPEPVDTRTGMEIATERLAEFGIEVVD